MARSTAQLTKIIVAPFSKLHREINSSNKLASEQGKHRARRKFAIVHNLSIG